MSNISRNKVDYYKNKLNESILFALGRGVRAAKRAAKAIWNIPGVKPVTRTAAVAGGVAGGMYAYDKYIKPDQPLITPGATQRSANRPSGVSATGVRQPSSYTRSTIVPVENRGGEATRKYGEMLRSPGGVAGAMRRQRAEEIWSKWKAEDAEKEASLPAIPSRESELARIKASTKEMESQLRAQFDAEERRANAIRQTPEYKKALEELQGKKQEPVVAKNNTVQTPSVPKANQPMDLGAGANFQQQAQKETEERKRFAANFQQQAQKEAGELESRRKKIASDFKMSMQSGPKANKPMDLNQ